MKRKTLEVFENENNESIVDYKSKFSSDDKLRKFTHLGNNLKNNNKIENKKEEKCSLKNADYQFKFHLMPYEIFNEILSFISDHQLYRKITKYSRKLPLKTYECISDVNRTQTLLKLARVCNELYDKLLKNKTIMKNCCFTMKYEYDVKDIIKLKPSYLIRNLRICKKNVIDSFDECFYSEKESPTNLQRETIETLIKISKNDEYFNLSRLHLDGQFGILNKSIIINCFEKMIGGVFDAEKYSHNKIRFHVLKSEFAENIDKFINDNADNNFFFPSDIFIKNIKNQKQQTNIIIHLILNERFSIYKTYINFLTQKIYHWKQIQFIQ
jgi:hypothetical protein